MVPWYTMVPWHHGAMVPWYHGDMAHGTSTLDARGRLLGSLGWRSPLSIVVHRSGVTCDGIACRRPEGELWRLFEPLEIRTSQMALDKTPEHDLRSLHGN